MKKYLIVLSILMLSFILWQCAQEPSEKLAGEMAGEIALLPADADVIGYMNVKSVKDSPFFSFVEKNLDDNPFYSDEYEEFIEATGLDFREDIDEVYFSFSHGEEEDDPDMFTMVKGNYQPDRIMDYIMEESNPDITEENFRLCSIGGSVTYNFQEVVV